MTAWCALVATMHVTPDESRRGVQLIDPRIHTPLVTATGRPAWLGEYHDLRELLGRGIFNPRRKLTDVPDNRAQLLASMRKRLDLGLAEACTDADLLTAAANPNEPLTLSRVCRIWTWYPPQSAATPAPGRPAPGRSAPGAFQFAEPGVTADLWNLPTQSARHFRSHAPVLPRVAA